MTTQFRYAMGALVVLFGTMGAGTAPANAAATCYGKAATITGSGTINGTAGDDVIIGSAGNDRIWGRGGNDIICSFSGDDRVEGGPGNDWVNGGNGADTVYGQDGADTLIGGQGADDLRGGPGNDEFYGQGEADRISGGTGNDNIFADGGDDQVFGGAGDDRIAAGEGRDRVWGDVGNDTLKGDASDTLDGGPGTDSCAGTSRLFNCERAAGQPAPSTSTTTPPTAPPAQQAGNSWFRQGMPVPVANGAEIWVSPSGNDSANGSKGAPLRSIQVAVDRASPGTTIYLMNGRWDGRGRSGIGYVTIGAEDSGTPGNWLRLTNAPGARPHLVIQQGEGIRIEGAYIEVSGLKIEGQGGGPGPNHSVSGPQYGYGILIPNRSAAGNTTPAHHVVIADNEVSGFSISGIATDEANFVVVGGNRVHGNSNWGAWGGSGISFLEHSNAGGGGNGRTTGWITNNLVYRNEQKVNSVNIGINSITDGNCIILDRMNVGSGNGQKTLISENSVSSCGGRGINVYQSSNVTAERNLSWHNGLTPALSGEMYFDGTGNIARGNTVVPRPGRQNIIGNVQWVNNVILSSSTTLDSARSQHRSRTGANVPG